MFPNKETEAQGVKGPESLSLTKGFPGDPGSSPDPAVGGSDHPVLADEGAPAEVEASAVLEEDGEESVLAGHQQPPGLTPGGPIPQCVPHSGVELFPYLQGHLPGPGARDSVLPIDDPREATQHGVDGRNPAAWGWEHGVRDGDPGSPLSQDPPGTTQSDVCFSPDKPSRLAARW